MVEGPPVRARRGDAVPQATACSHRNLRIENNTPQPVANKCGRLKFTHTTTMKGRNSKTPATQPKRRRAQKTAASNVTVKRTPQLAQITRPTIRTMQDQRGVIVKRREMIYVGSDSAFGPDLLMTFQPGVMDWLGPIASRYEYYEVLSARVFYESYAPTSTGGVVCLAIDYDVHDSAPDTLDNMSNGYHSAVTANWQSMSFDVQVQNINPRKLYTCGGGYPVGADRKFYDAFNLYGFGGNKFQGTVWVEYALRFSSPQISFDMSGSIDSPPSADIETDGSGNQFVKLPVVSSQSAPVSVVDATYEDGIAGLCLAAKALNLAPGVERGFCVRANIDAADPTADIITKSNGVTLTPLYDTAITIASDVAVRFYKAVAGRSGGNVQFGLLPASGKNLTGMAIDAFTVLAKSIG